MRILFYGLLGLVALVLAVVVFFFVALPTDYVRDQAIALVKARTGRDLAINGSTSFSIYPRFSVKLENVELSPPPGMQGDPFLRMKELEVQVPLWPLLRHEIDVERFVLVEPAILLHTDKEGRRSWDMAAAAGEDAAAPADTGLRGAVADPAEGMATAPAATNAAPAGIGSLGGLRLADVRIERGSVRILDDRSGQDETIGEVDAKVSLESIDSPLAAEGGLTWNAQRITYTLEAATLSGLLAGSETPVSFKIASDTVTTGFKGKVKLATPLLLAGALDLDTASVRELAAWLRHPLPPGGGLGPLALRADVTAGGSKVTASNAAVKLDGATAKGILGLELAGKRPMLRADLAIDQLDLNPYLAGAEVAPQGKAAKAKASGDTSGGSATAVATPAVASTSTGWSNAPIDLSALNLLDADAKIAAGSIRLRNIKIGRSTVQATLTGGLLKARLPAMQLYGGQGTGALSVDARAPAAKIDSNFNLKAIQVQPLLTDAAGIDRLAGSGDVSFGGASSGRSQKELVSALMGQGKAQLADGAVVGVNVARAVRSMQSGNFTDWTSDPEAKTDFSSLTATFTVTNGVAANQDLTLVGPLVRVTGSGTASLPGQSLDYTLQPTLVASLEGQGGAADLSGLTIPVRIVGPWGSPSTTVDVGALAKNPQAALDTVKKAVGKVKGGEKVQQAIDALANSKEGQAIGGLLGGLLGGQQQGMDPAAEPAQ